MVEFIELNNEFVLTTSELTESFAKSTPPPNCPLRGIVFIFVRELLGLSVNNEEFAIFPGDGVLSK
jgi:hypothetical protein